MVYIEYQVHTKSLSSWYIPGTYYVGAGGGRGGQRLYFVIRAARWQFSKLLIRDAHL